MASSRRILVVCAAVATAACGTGDPDPQYWSPSSDLGGATTPLPKPKPKGAPAGPSIEIAFTPVNQGGTYAPKNVGAVWVEDGAGQYLATIDYWGGIFITQLYKWIEVRGGTFDASAVDAVSGATAVAYAPHKSYWDMTDKDGFALPAGTYYVTLEVTDRDEPGATYRFELPLGPGAQDFAPPTDPNGFYSGIFVKYPDPAMGVVP